MGHSGGGIISRWFIEKEGGKELVDRLFLLASPWDGSPKAVYMLFQGMDTVMRVKFNPFGMAELTKKALRTFPAMYELIPQARPFLSDATEKPVDPFAGNSWLDSEEQLALLEDGRKFNVELGNDLSLRDTIVFVGRKLDTTSRGVASLGDNNRWSAIQWEEKDIGDGTLVEYSAFFPSARVNMPVVAGHGEIYISPALIDMLRLEMHDKYTQLQSAAIEEKAPKTDAAVRIGREVYAPGETVQVQVRLSKAKDGAPVARASVKGALKWVQELPGNAAALKAARLPKVTFAKVKGRQGEYTAEFAAPKDEGYYELATRVKVTGQDELVMHDLFAVEDGTI